MSQKSLQHVVIYGGGMAGAILAKQLASFARITLVDPNEYFEVPMSAPRSLVLPAFADQAIIPFKKALPGVTHIRGSLIELDADKGTIQLSSGGQMHIKGAVDVLATGSTFSNPLMRASNSTVEERKSFYQRYSQCIEKAGHVLIVGGGPIGVEIAGEISENYPGKKLTIVERGARILSSTSKAASEVATKELRARGVEILTNETLQRNVVIEADVFSTAGVVHTASGKKILYDFIIWCTGGKPNTDYMRPKLCHTLNEKGQIKVDPYLAVTGMKNTFALGDITDLDENKMAWHVAKQVEHAAHNIRQLLSGYADHKSLKTHRAQTGNPMMAVTLGSRKGVLHLPLVGVIKCSLITRAAKAGHMLVPKYRKELGLPKQG
ncbi:FAD-dependent oxidoreductase [Pseudomonas sp. GM17]|uniref:NAD(P)/FAD-dependent oxidoreductase n=1 Tax=Pseudomonas sp. GM17 TaxID=1144323 RepID=UPI0002724AC0|nr:FAD-dependent oxidoreductase [Pseudomonas sp. GM17]WIE49828.1 FAD-dependent oxidoreductase [Pseudomonas sp. GM17]